MGTYKIVLMGSGGVGKSALVIRLTTEQFVSNHDPTIEDQYHFPTSVDGEEASLDILDTAGQEEYSVMHDQWIREGQAFLILFSVDEASTFENAHAMRKKIERAKDVDSFPMVLVGTKCDKPNREVSKQQGMQRAAEIGCEYIETSAKSGMNVKEAFDLLVREIRKERKVQPSIKSEGCKCSIS